MCLLETRSFLCCWNWLFILLYPYWATVRTRLNSVPSCSKSIISAAFPWFSYASELDAWSSYTGKVVHFLSLWSKTLSWYLSLLLFIDGIPPPPFLAYIKHAAVWAPSKELKASKQHTLLTHTHSLHTSSIFCMKMMVILWNRPVSIA